LFVGSGKFVVLILFFAASVCPANTPLTLEVSNATAPPGGWVQIKVFSATPQLISTGGIALNLDPTVFGPVADVAVFSADGDAYGFVTFSALSVDAYSIAAQMAQ
jgi:hypothetical protein